MRFEGQRLSSDLKKIKTEKQKAVSFNCERPFFIDPSENAHQEYSLSIKILNNYAGDKNINKNVLPSNHAGFSLYQNEYC